MPFIKSKRGRRKSLPSAQEPTDRDEEQAIVADVGDRDAGGSSICDGDHEVVVNADGRDAHKSISTTPVTLVPTEANLNCVGRMFSTKQLSEMSGHQKRLFAKTYKINKPNDNLYHSLHCDGRRAISSNKRNRSHACFNAFAHHARKFEKHVGVSGAFDADECANNLGWMLASQLKQLFENDEDKSTAFGMAISAARAANQVSPGTVPPIIVRYQGSDYFLVVCNGVTPNDFTVDCGELHRYQHTKLDAKGLGEKSICHSKCTGFGLRSTDLQPLAHKTFKCRCCQETRRNVAKRLGNKSKSQADASSRAKVVNLTPDTMRFRIRNLGGVVKNQSQVIRRLKANFTKFLCDEDDIPEDERPELGQLGQKELEKVLSFVADDAKAKTDTSNVLKEMLENSLEEAKLTNTTQSEEELQEMHDTMIELFNNQIQNHIKRMKGQPTGARYSPRVIRLALEIYTRSKSGYACMRTMMPLPCARRLQQISSVNTRHAGYDENPYILAEARNDNEGGDCQLVFDELQLVQDVYWSTAHHTIEGFVDPVSHQPTLAAFVECYLGKNDGDTSTIAEPPREKTKADLSKKINQFKLVFFGSKFTVMGEYFTNNGTLTAVELR
jgi:hypothetical protein